MVQNSRLSTDELCWRCDLSDLGFSTSAELEPLTAPLGQARAMEALDYAIGMNRPGYNVFVLGEEGLGRRTVLQRFLNNRACTLPAPSDWCYVSNFDAPRKPRAIKLPAGRGLEFQQDLDRFVEEVSHALRAGFEGEEYRRRRQVIESEFREQQEQMIGEIEAAASERSVVLLRTPVGFAFAPVRDNKVLAPDAFNELSEEDRKRFEKDIEEMQERLRQALEETPAGLKRMREQIKKLNDETASFAVGYMILALKNKYQDHEEIMDFLEKVRLDVVANVEFIVAAPEPQGTPKPPGRQTNNPVLRRYRVNLVVDNGKLDCAPVIYEDEPSFDRLLGRIEHRAEMGALMTDLLLIRAGALHRANGGFLVIDARRLLTSPMAWDGLKRALFASELRIEPLAQMLGAISTVTLEPMPIPLDIKVLIIGERRVFHLLTALDPEFARLFKVAADFDDRLPREGENRLLYARFIATIVRDEKLPAFTRSAVARVLEQSARRSGDAERLSLHLEDTADLLRESAYWAGKSGREKIDAADVEAAVDARLRRLGRIRERMLEEIDRGTIMIDTEGMRSGQVNGLSVLQIGALVFGRPSRITARVRLGQGKVMDIEREVELGGPLHSKGVLILGGYLSAHFARDVPLSVSATLVFEQSYGGVDGDSASSAELFALLSALSGVPIKQSFAVTGSVNQLGQIQAIGGVNEKIEGFFDVCNARGLTGEQGVLIPQSNVKHLMLDRRVVDAVRAGKFHIHAVSTIDQGIEVLTGVSAGLRDAKGHFPRDSINGLVEANLLAMAEKRRTYGSVLKSEAKSS